jgi:hypothetical protein
MTCNIAIYVNFLFILIFIVKTKGIQAGFGLMGNSLLRQFFTLKYFWYLMDGNFLRNESSPGF